jgi:hypothetical protein
MFIKSEVNFESPATGMNHCIECVHYIAGRCEIVKGVVLPGDWCNQFKKRSSMTVQKSPSQINQEQACETHENREAADARSSHPGEGILEHGLHISSRTRPGIVEVTFGPQGGGLVPANPFASLAQEGFLHSHPEKLGAKKLAEFDRATKGRSLPKRVKK